MSNRHTISELDKKILSLLDKDCRLGLDAIAKRLHVSRQTVSYRLKRIEGKRIIIGNKTIFDSGVVGYGWYRVLIRLVKIQKAQREEIIAFLRDHPNTTWLGEVGGRWDIVVNFACEGPAEFSSISDALSAQFGRIIKEFDVLVYIDIYDYSRSYLNPTDPLRKDFFHRMARDKSLVLDELDYQIIFAIANHALFDYVELGKKLGVSRNTVKNRIDRLTEKKVILGYRSFIDLEKVGYESNMLFLQINSLDRERETELYAYLKMLPQVTFVVKHVGKWKIGMEVETKNAREFQKLLIDLRSTFDDLISDYETFPLFKDHRIDYFPKGLRVEKARLLS